MGFDQEDLNNTKTCSEQHFSENRLVWTGDEKFSKFDWLCLGMVVLGIATSVSSYYMKEKIEKEQGAHRFKNHLKQQLLNSYNYSYHSEFINAIVNQDLQKMKREAQQKRDLNEYLVVGVTPLMFASAFGSKEMVEWLLNQGVKIDVKDNRGLTALDYALYANNKSVASFIKKKMEEKRDMSQVKIRTFMLNDNYFSCYIRQHQRV